MRRAVGLPDRHGVLVLRVKRNSAAEGAGLARGDLVVAAAGEDVHTIGDLHRAVAHAGPTLPLSVVRGAEERSVDISLQTA
jgi:S1-C subfamily serine protease